MSNRDFSNDVSYDLAYHASLGTSFVPERRAKSTRDEYTHHMTGFWAEILELAGPEREAEALAELERYRAGYLRRYTRMLSIKSGIMSPMIVGPSNFPTERMRKRNDSYDKRLREWADWQDYVSDKIRAKFDGRVQPIRAGDTGSIALLQEKLAKAEKFHGQMVATNKIVNVKKTSPETKLELLRRVWPQREISELQAMMTRAKWNGKFGFEAYELSNSNGRIKQIKEQLAKAEKLAAQETTETMVYGVRVVNNVEENRLQLFLPDSPRFPDDLFKMLSGHGFRWSRTNKCLQAFRGNNANYWGQLVLNMYRDRLKAAEPATE